MYNDQSANEHLSLSVGFKILQARECNLFTAMSRDDYFYLRRCAFVHWPGVVHHECESQRLRLPRQYMRRPHACELLPCACAAPAPRVGGDSAWAQPSH